MSDTDQAAQDAGLEAPVVGDEKRNSISGGASSPTAAIMAAGLKMTPSNTMSPTDHKGEPYFTKDEVKRLYKRFMKLDKDGNGKIDKDEFLAIPQIANNPLVARLIAIFDEDGGGDVDFNEFIVGLSVFSGRGNKESKLRFAFKVYDMDRDGYISNGELFLVLKMMVGSNLKDNQLQQIVDKTIMEADADGDGKISFEEFMAVVENTDIAKQMIVTGV